MFNSEYYKNTTRNMQTEIFNENSDDFLHDFSMKLFQQSLDSKESLEMYNKSLFECCDNYISLSKFERTLFPDNALEFAKTIL